MTKMTDAELEEHVAEIQQLESRRKAQGKKARNLNADGNKKKEAMNEKDLSGPVAGFERPKGKFT